MYSVSRRERIQDRPNQNDGDWDRPLTPDELEYNRVTAAIMRSVTRQIETTTLFHPTTGEIGQFCDYVHTGAGLRARYVTPSGRIFSR